MSSWATKEDLYARYGQEFMAKIALRRNWDEELNTWIASEGVHDIGSVINLALEDAKTLILQRISCFFSNYQKVINGNFPAVKVWHIRTTIDVLKANGDCASCDCKDLDNFLKCNSLCDENGICLNKKSTFISASVAKFDCECNGSCRCC